MFKAKYMFGTSNETLSICRRHSNANFKITSAMDDYVYPEGLVESLSDVVLYNPRMKQFFIDFTIQNMKFGESVTITSFQLDTASSKKTSYELNDRFFFAGKNENVMEKCKLVYVNYIRCDGTPTKSSVFDLGMVSSSTYFSL